MKKLLLTTILACLFVFYGLPLSAATVMPSNYFAAGTPGDIWKYERLDGSKYISTLSAITTGTNAGRMRLGNSSE